MSEEKNRVIILFGSGAAIPWGAPKTSDLTELIKNSAPKFLCEDGKTKLSKYIYDAIKKSGYSNDDINFETIISIIEELIIYYSYFDSKKELSSFSRVLFSSRFEKDILNFSIKGGVKKHGFFLQIPKDTDYNFSKPSHNSEPPEQFYFQHFLSELLTNICAEIPEYDYHSKVHSVILSENNTKNNKNFRYWIKKLAEHSIVRMYTLNYDRLFKVLSMQAELDVFEGFDVGEFVTQHGIKPNVQRILNDFTSNIHYNLHGSAYWEVHSTDENTQLPDPWISLEPYPIFEINNIQNSILQIEKGKNILISNIITGF